MLNTLKNIETEKAEKALAKLVKYLTPQPAIKGELNDIDLSQFEVSLFDEIKQRAKVATSKLSDKERAKLFDIIVKELSQPILDGPRAQKAKERLGARGDLRSDLYQVQFKDGWDAEMRGVRRDHVEHAIQQPDMFEHLLSNRFTDEDMPSLSLFAKTIGRHGSKDIFTLIVQAGRKADKQFVQNAWRAYHSDVDLARATTVLEMLKAFVNVYGVDFYIGDKIRHRFLLNEVYNLPQPHQTFNFLQIADPSNDTLLSSPLFKISPLGVIEISVAYVINITRYQHDLRKHNVQIKMNSR